MPVMTIEILDHLPEAHVQAAVDLYYTSLQAKLAPVFGPAKIALAVLSQSLHRSRCLVALDRSQVVGILGIHDARVGFLEPSYQTMIKHYGTFLGMTRLLMLMLLDHKLPPGDLYLDGIAVISSRRGQGIGTALIAAFEQHARDNGFETVSLEVIDANPRAQKLYERLGFQQVATHFMGPFSRLFGFHTTRRMMKAL
jgi:ribosomal protein S18 acetylase RimI-like enzyme